MAPECKNVNQSRVGLYNTAPSDSAPFCCEDAAGQIVCLNGPAQTFTAGSLPHQKLTRVTQGRNAAASAKKDENSNSNLWDKIKVPGIIALVLGGAIYTVLNWLGTISFAMSKDSEKEKLQPPDAATPEPAAPEEMLQSRPGKIPESRTPTALEVLEQSEARARELHSKADQALAAFGQTTRLELDYLTVQQAYLEAADAYSHVLTDDIRTARDAHLIRPTDAIRRALRVRQILHTIHGPVLGDFYMAGLYAHGMLYLHQQLPAADQNPADIADCVRLERTYALAHAIARGIATEPWFANLPKGQQISVTHAAAIEAEHQGFVPPSGSAAGDSKVLTNDDITKALQTDSLGEAGKTYALRRQIYLGDVHIRIARTRLALGNPEAAGAETYKALSYYEAACDGVSLSDPTNGALAAEATQKAAETAEMLGLYHRAQTYYQRIGNTSGGIGIRRFKSNLMSVGNMAASRLSREAWFKELSPNRQIWIIEAVVTSAEREIEPHVGGLRTPSDEQIGEARRILTDYDYEQADGINRALKSMGEIDGSVRSVPAQITASTQEVIGDDASDLDYYKKHQAYGQEADLARQKAQEALSRGDLPRAAAFFYREHTALVELHIRGTAYHTRKMMAQALPAANTARQNMVDIYTRLGYAREAIETLARLPQLFPNTANEAGLLAEQVYNSLVDIPEYRSLSTADQIAVAQAFGRACASAAVNAQVITGTRGQQSIRPDKIHIALAASEMSAARALATSAVSPYDIAETAKVAGVAEATTVRGAEGKVDGAPKVELEGKPPEAARREGKDLLTKEGVR